MDFLFKVERDHIPTKVACLRSEWKALIVNLWMSVGYFHLRVKLLCLTLHRSLLDLSTEPCRLYYYFVVVCWFKDCNASILSAQKM